MINIKEQFPILNEKVNENKLVYLDSGATALTPNMVIEKQNEYFLKYNANVHRGVATLSGKATLEFEEARTKIAKFINATEEEVIFSKGTTNSMNQLTMMLDEFVNSKSNIVVSIQEHHSNMIPWQQLAKRHGAELRFVELDKNYGLDIDDLKSKVDQNTIIVSLTHMSNVIGETNDIKTINKIVKEQSNAYTIFDGAQAITHHKVDVKEISCDFYCFSGHKLFGPTGIGVLYGKKEILKNVRPCEYGGEMMASVTREDLTYAELPHKFEAGTPNIAGAIGLGAAIDFVNAIGIENLEAYVTELTQYAAKKIAELDFITIYGSIDKKTSLVTFNMNGIHSHDLTTFLDEKGIQVRAGHHCNQLILESMCTSSTARASFQIYNTKSDVDDLVEALIEAKEFFAWMI